MQLSGKVFTPPQNLLAHVSKGVEFKTALGKTACSKFGQSTIFSEEQKTFRLFQHCQPYFS